MDELTPLGDVYSGKVIGAVVKALNLDQGVLKDRTARRFFAGYSVSEHNRKEVLNELGKVLIEHGIVPVPALLRQSDVSMAAIIAEAIEFAAIRWDNLLATIQSRSTPITDRQLAVEQFLRLVVVDLALRVFALLRLARLEAPPPDAPSWALENGGGKLLRELAEKSGLTRYQLADSLGVSYTSVDNWLDGKNRPTFKNIEVLADMLTGLSTDMTAQHLKQKIQRQFTFAHIADLLASLIGRERTVDLSTALVRLVWLITQDVQQMDRLPIEEDPSGELIALWFGTANSSTHVLLRNLADSETDERWKKDILMTTTDWSIPFQMVALQASGPRNAAGLAQDIQDIPRLGNTGGKPDDSSNEVDPAQEALQQLGTKAFEQEYQRVAQGILNTPSQMLEAGITQRRGIVRNFPLSPLAHFDLGSYLGMAGKNLSRRDLIDQGVLECKISAGLLPNWDAPAVEPGIILANIGEFGEALRELNRAKAELPEETPHLRCTMGYVLMELSKYAEALEQFEKVIESRPDYALAFLYAARCAFRLGHKARGLRHAKTARILGEPDEYTAWKNGEYSSRRRT